MTGGSTSSGHIDGPQTAPNCVRCLNMAPQRHYGSVLRWVGGPGHDSRRFNVCPSPTPDCRVGMGPLPRSGGGSFPRAHGSQDELRTVLAETRSQRRGFFSQQTGSVGMAICSMHGKPA